MKQFVLLAVLSMLTWSCTKEKTIIESEEKGEVAISPAKNTNIVFSEKVRLNTVNASSGFTQKWTCALGSFVGSSTSSSVEWQAPDSVGTFEVQTLAINGKDTIRATVNLEVVGYFFEDFIDLQPGWTADSIAERRPSGGMAVVEPLVGASSTTLGYSFAAAPAPFSIKTTIGLKDSASFQKSGYFQLYLPFAEPVDASQPFVSNLHVTVYPLESQRNCYVRIYTYNPTNRTGEWTTLVNWITVGTFSGNEFKTYAISITKDKQFILYINGRKEMETPNLQGLNFSASLSRFYYLARQNAAILVDNMYLTTDGTMYR